MTTYTATITVTLQDEQVTPQMADELAEQFVHELVADAAEHLQDGEFMTVVKVQRTPELSNWAGPDADDPCPAG